MSEMKLSQELEKSDGYIQSITSGRSSASIEMIFEICEFFDISVSDFFYEEINLSSEKYATLELLRSNINKLDDSDFIIIATLARQLVEKNNSI